MPSSIRACQLLREGQFSSIEDCEAKCSPSPIDSGCPGSFCLGAYYPNWAQYRTGPFRFTVEQLKGVLPKYDYLVYSFGKFDPKTFVVSGTEESLGIIKDTEQIRAIQTAALELGKPNFKLLFSIGGWTFPAAYWSLAVSTAANRTKLINECVKYLKANNLQGIDIDWEFPGAAATTKYVQKAHTCNSTGVQCTELGDASIENPLAVDGVCVIEDAGQLPGVDDFHNLGLFVQEMSVVFRQQSPPYMLTIAAAASPDMIQRYNFDLMINAIDVWHVMAYDFWVSDTTNKEYSGCTAPTAPLYNAFPDVKRGPVSTSLNPVRRRLNMRLDPSQTCRPTGADQNLSIDNAVRTYLGFGVHPKSIALGLAFYGHTWSVPDLTGTDYAQFGILSQNKSGNCCGPLADTYGGYGGTAAVLCGSLLYSEVNLNRNNLQTFEDPITRSTIGYWSEASGGESGVPKGTWISYNSPASIKELTEYATTMGLRGVFAWDISSDTVLPAADGGAARWTFDLSTVVYDTLNDTVDPVCSLNYVCPSPSFCVNDDRKPTCYCGSGVVYDDINKCSSVVPPPTPVHKYTGVCPKSSAPTSCNACSTASDCGTAQCYADLDQKCCPNACSWLSGASCTANWNPDHSSLMGFSCNCPAGTTGIDCSGTAGGPVPVQPPLTTSCPVDCHDCYDSAANKCMGRSEVECRGWMSDTRYMWCG